MTGMRLISNQWKAMFKKRLLYTSRNLFSPIMQIVLSVAIIIAIAYMASLMQDDIDLPPMEISASKYKRPVSLLEQHDGTNDLLSKYALIRLA